MQIINRLNGDTVETRGRAWWLTHALETKDGVAVACIDAISTTLRMPSAAQLAADPELNPYWTDAANEGDFAYYGIRLTEADLASYGITPGLLVYPEIVDAPRPATNRSDKVTSAVAYRQSMDWVENDCIGRPSDY